MAEGVGRASLFLASGTVVSRVLGFVKAIVLASTIGVVNTSADAFAVANQLPNNLYVIIAGGVLSAILVPQIVRASSHVDGGAGYINKLITVALVILGTATVLATLLAPVITTLYAVDLSGAEFALAVAFAYWCLPQIFFYGLYTVLGEVLNARKAFGPFTWAPVLNNLVAIAGLVVFLVVFGGDPTGSRSAQDWDPAMIALLAGSASAGVAAQALILFFFWRRVGLRYRPDFRWRGVGLGTAGRMASWTFGMLLLTQLAGLVETNVALSVSGGGDASVAVIQNAWLIFMLPHSVITVSVATVYFTHLAEHAREGRTPALIADVSSSVRGISAVIVLAAGVLAVCAYPFAAVFIPQDPDQVQAFGNVIIAYLVGLVPFSILFVIQRTFYALNDTRTPFLFTAFQVGLVILGCLGCLLLPDAWVAVGIALVISTAGIAQAFLAAALLRRRLGHLDGRRILRSLVRFGVALLVPLAVGVLLLHLLGGTGDGFAVSGRLGAIVSMALIGAVMSVLYVVGLKLLRVSELDALTAPLLARFGRGPRRG